MTQKEYSNQQITVTWNPGLCIHSEKCFHGLGKVFDPNRRPWIDLSQAPNIEIKDQVNKCPSGALSMKENSASNQELNATKVQLFEGGPLVIKGVCEIESEEGTQEIKKNAAFCRCTKSANFPYCDGSHNR